MSGDPDGPGPSGDLLASRSVVPEDPQNVEIAPLTRVQKWAAGALAKNWTQVPHVTHHDDADITLLNAYLQSAVRRDSEPKTSLLAFVVKASVAALQKHPRINASLDDKVQNLIVKRFYNIGVAIDTPVGLVVGVVTNCDKKKPAEITSEVAKLAKKARDKGLALDDMSGGTFTVSSLGNIGGTYFTPIVNAPELAILGVGRAQWRPFRGEMEKIDWRLMLPLSLSYDHRAVNGANAAAFVSSVVSALRDPYQLEN